MREMPDKLFRLRHLMLLVSAGYIPTGIVFGALAFILGLKIEYTLSLSAFVYSGAVQSTVLGFWVSGVNIPSLIIIAFLLNLRHSFYGIHMERNLDKLTTMAILVIAPFLTDEVYGLVITNDGIGTGDVKKLALWAYGNWIAATATGYVLLSGLPSTYLLELSIALSALFLGLFVPKVRGMDTGIVVIASLCVATVLRISNAPQYLYITAIFTGFAAGLIYRIFSGGEKSA